MTSALLKELCQVKHGGTPSKGVPAYWQGTIPWVSPKDMKASLLHDAADHISEDAIANSATSLVPERTVLVVARSGILAHSLPVAQAGCPLAFNQDIKALLPDPRKVDPDYLYWFVRSSEQAVLAQGVKKGATVHSLQSGYLENLAVPLPSRQSQRDIAELLTRAEGIVRLRRESRAKAQAIIPALFIDMFGDPATNPKGWSEPTLGSIVDEFRYGTSQKSGDAGLPTLRIPNVVGDRLDPTEIKLVAVSDAEAERLRLRNGDLLFVRTNGNPDYVGRSAVYESDVMQSAGFDGHNCLYASYLIRARLRLDTVNPRFLQSFLSSSEGRKRLREKARTSAGQYNINTDGLASIRIPLPPLQFQADFEDRCRPLFGLQELQLSAIEKAEATFQALLSRAFSGNLTATPHAADEAAVA